MKGWREKLRGKREEIKKNFEDRRKWLREKLDEIKKEAKRREREWQEEKKELVDRIKRLEEGSGRGERGRFDEERKGKERGGEEMENKVRGIERRMELNEKKERKRNIIIRGIEAGEGEERAAVEKLLKEVGAEIIMVEVNRGGKRERSGEDNGETRK